MNATLRLPLEERVLILASTSGRVVVSRETLTEAGFGCEVLADLSTFCKEVQEGAGAILLTEEAFADGTPDCLIEVLGRQPSWSDLPIILLAHQAEQSPLAVTALELLGNVTVLEEPARVTTLVTCLRSALKARNRQYLLRDRIDALRESEQRFARFMQHLPGLAWIKNAEGRYVYANEAAERAFRTPRAELYGKSDDQVFPPATAAQFKENDRRARESETGIQTVETLEQEDGVVHSSIVSKFPIPGTDSGPPMIGGMAIDITELQHAEHALRESEARFRFLAETIPSIVWTAGPDGTITYANRRWLEYTGLTQEQNTTSWPELVLHPDDYERCVAKWNEALREGKPYEIEVRNRRHDGVYRWFVTRAVPLRDDHGSVVSWFGITTDINDQKELQERLREADRRKDEFLATLAHELRNPLAPISNSLHILRAPRDRVADDGVLNILQRQVNHLVRLVDDLLELSRITRGKIELRKDRVDLSAIVHSAVETSRPLIDAGQHRLTIRMDPEPITLEADPVRLAQVIANLLNNAAKYTDRGGRIWLTTKRERSDVIVSVRDNGVGIPPEMLPDIFGMFTQADRSLGQAQGGLGIGLTLAQSLAHMHGGNMEARSDGPGKGSEFVVRLPVGPVDQHVKAVEAREKVAAESRASVGRRILVVDDNVDSAESLGMLLEMKGHDVRVAHGGEAALTVARAYRPEVVLLDIGLPDVDGYEVATRLRREPGLERMLLIAMTGYGQEEDRRRSHIAGFDEHLVKPVDFNSLQVLLSSGAVVDSAVRRDSNKG